MMGTTGVRIFNNMLDAAGSFGSGLVSVLTQIAPLAEWVSQGFKKMGQAFNEWAQSVEGQMRLSHSLNILNRICH